MFKAFQVRRERPMSDAKPIRPIWLKVGDVARAAGVSVETLRYYERLGLLPAVSRTGGGQRRYRTSTIDTLRVIHLTQRLGYSLLQIAELFTFTRTGGAEHAGLNAAVRDIDGRIADLTAIRAALISQSVAFPEILPSYQQEIEDDVS